MVYDGRPSKGCYTCRKRRIKCDTGRPICGQCSKSKRECLGYRDEHDIYFRNQTYVTELRVKRFENRKHALERRDESSSHEESGGSTPSSESRALMVMAPSKSFIPAAVAFPIELIAVNGFFENFVLSSRHPECSSGHLRYLPKLYQNAPGDSALALSTAAMSFAARSLFSEHRQRYLDLAWRTYGLAISKLNEALQDPIKARQNETLMAIMLFGSIESLLATPAPKYARSKHIEGAVALLRLRGKELIEDEITSSLYLTVRTHMLLDRVQRSKPAEAIFYNKSSGWQHKLARRMQNVNTKLTQYIILMPVLRNKAIQLLEQPLNSSSSKEVSDFLSECKRFDMLLCSWPATIPEDWQYLTVSRVENVPKDSDFEHIELFPGDVDVYYDGWVACVWNSWRCSRMFVNAIILRCIAFLSPTDIDLNEEPNYVLGKESLQKMVNEICSSVPFHIGYNPSATPETETCPDDFPGLKQLDPKALAAYFLLWPLFVARSAMTIPQRQRSWLRGRMVAILQRFGTVHAKWLVEIGDNDEKRPLFADHWHESMFENIMESSNLYASGGV